MTKTETIIIEEILNTVPNVGFKSPFLSSQIVNFILTPFQVKRTVNYLRHNYESSSQDSQVQSLDLYLGTINFPKKFV